jgi:GNAT superfamily N-acetyltransferase
VTVAQPQAARPADLAAIRTLLAAHGNDGPTDRADVVGPYLAHLIEHTRAMVVRERGRLVAFGAVIDAGVAVHLTDLFVQPDRLGEGIGRPLLAALFDDRWPRTTFASDDPRALPVYVRAGMSPSWPNLYLEGDSTAVTGGGDLSTEPATSERLAELERSWRGVDRPVDHAFWATEAGADPFVVRDGGVAVAFAYARDRQMSLHRAISRMVVRPDADPAPAVAAALRRAGRGRGVGISLLGPSPLLRPLLDAGFRIEDRDTFMTSDPELVDPARLYPNPGML